MAGQKGRSGGKRKGTGGPRQGAGRRRGPALPWNQINEQAEAGTPEHVIFTALGLKEAELRAAGQLDGVRAAIARGHAKRQAELHVEVRRRGQRTRKNDGSVYALALASRNIIGWDQRTPNVEPEPDLSTAKELVDETFNRNAINRSQLLGRAVTPEDVLYQIRHGRWPWEAAMSAAPRPTRAPCARASREKKKGRPAAKARQKARRKAGRKGGK